MELKEFQHLISNNPDTNIIVYFSADYCAPCKGMRPIFNEFLTKSNECIMQLVDMAQSPDIGIQYKITKIPLLRIYRNSNLLDEYVGTDKGKFKQLLQKYCN